MSGDRDIVERLREAHQTVPIPSIASLYSNAADEIERLEAARQQLLNAARGYMDMVCEERDKNERLRAERGAEHALADQLHNALCLVAVDLSGPKTAAALAAYEKARTNGSASATDVGAQP